jgi:limonene-1,2-epoxide hydrolase
MQPTPMTARAGETGRASNADGSPIAVVESFLAAFAAQDLERALALMADDIVYQNVPFPADRGKKAVERTLAAFGKVVTGFEVKMLNIAARDGVVLTERIDILKGPLVYLDLPVCGTFEVRDGKIVLWRDYFDLMGATAKLLVSPIRWLLLRGRREGSGT